MHTACLCCGASGMSATGAVSSMRLCMHVCAWSGAFIAHGLGWTDNWDPKVGDDIGVPKFWHHMWHIVKVLLFLYTILFNEATFKTVHWDFLLGTSNRSHSACMYHVTYRPVTPLCWIRFSVCISARAFTTSLSLAREWFRKSAGEFVGVFDCSKLRVSIATVVKKSPRLVCQGSIKVAVIRCWTQRKIESNRLHRITSQISCLPPVSSRREPERRLGPLKTRFTASTYVFAWRNTSTKVQRTALGSSATGLRLFQACGRSKRRTNYLK